MTIESGALEQAYAVTESSYGTLTSPASTDAIRHLEFNVTDKLNRERSPQKRGTPDHAISLARRRTAAWSLGNGFWEPSGTLGLAGYFAPLLKAGFGTQTSPALNTTINGVTNTPTITGSNLAVSVTNGVQLAVGDIIAVTRGTAREVTRIKTITSASTPTPVTHDTLSSTPLAGDVVTSGVNYKFATNLTSSVSMFLFHTGGGFKQCCQGSIVDKIEIMFDGTKEATIKMSGWGSKIVRTGFNQPGAHTTVGSAVAGMVGTFYLDAGAFLINQLTVTMTNSEESRNNELGTAVATGHFRGGARRTIDGSCSFYLEDTTVITNAEAVTRNVIRAAVGNTNGAMLGLVLPAMEWEIPEVPTTDGPKILTASGTGYASNTGNDGLFAAEL